MKALAKPFIFLRNIIGTHPIITFLIIFLSPTYIIKYGLIKYDLIVLMWGFLFFFSIGTAIYYHKNPTKKYNERLVKYEKDTQIDYEINAQNEFDDYKPLTKEEIKKLTAFISDTPNNNSSYKSSYESKLLLTKNEKYQFKIIQHWATNRDLLVFTKVRLLDLIEPRKDISNYKTALYKIQAKHIDFVICDQNAKVKCVIEIDDSSHNRPDRIERDKFVNEILQACGYKILHTYNITERQLDEICGYTT